MKEIWKPVIGYEGLYEVSNLGKIKSLNYRNTKKEGILSPGINTCGYEQVILAKDKVRKALFVHRIVAEAFLPNKNNYEVVNHKDENPRNNTLDNLEWCSRSYNALYGTCQKRRIKKLGKEIEQVKDKKVINVFQSISEAGRVLGKKNGSVICNALKGRLKTAYDCEWRYKNPELI